MRVSQQREYSPKVTGPIRTSLTSRSWVQRPSNFPEAQAEPRLPAPAAILGAPAVVLATPISSTSRSTFNPGEVFSYVEGCSGELSLGGAGFAQGGSGGDLSNTQTGPWGGDIVSGTPVSFYTGGTDMGGEGGGGRRERPLRRCDVWCIALGRVLPDRELVHDLLHDHVQLCPRHRRRWRRR